ncbi:transposase family protein [Spiroplasma endosymbiont of Melieria omissa]|uniref:transposase family protein n=5 Tax=Spiroplasma endosymbiont of Melieria omissa TaxID=3139324 RepID=UPI003CCB567D
MTYFELKDKPDQYFRKIVGINKLVFNEILNILLDHQNLKNTTGGRPYKMSIEDRLVMTLRYLYENRTYHSIGAEYDMVDTTALRNIRSIEDILINNNKFNNLTNKNIFLKRRIQKQNFDNWCNRSRNRTTKI